MHERNEQLQRASSSPAQLFWNVVAQDCRQVSNLTTELDDLKTDRESATRRPE